MKKVFAIALAVLMALSMVACGGKTEETEKADNTLKVIDINLTSEEYAYAVKKGDSELLQKVNDFLAEIQANGKFDEIMNKYFGDGTPTGVKSATLDSSKDQLVVATNAGFEPFEYTQGEYFMGVDMEIMGLFAESLGKELVISNMEFESVCTSVAEQQCDIAAAGLTVTDKRKETLDFSNSYYNASQVVVVKNTDTTFDACKTAEDVEKILNSMDSSKKAGVQSGTTGNFYVKGDESWGFAGFKITCNQYDVASLAAQDLVNGKIDMVIVDVAPAKAIVAKMNAAQ